MKKIIIVSTKPNTGGSLVLYKICELLREKGIDARVFLSETSVRPGRHRLFYLLKWLMHGMIHFKNYFFERNKKIKRQYIPIFNKKNTIVIYPEIIYGNPLFAENVVRYFLYYDRYKDYNNAYGEDDLFICYREQFNDWTKNPNGNRLNIRSFDKDLYKQINFGERKGNCYLFYKGKNRNDLPNKLDGILLDDLSEEDKVKELNKCECCYIYDMQTFYANIAAVCGCIPILIMEEGKNKDDYRKNDDKESVGIAYGNIKKEIEHAINTRQQLIDRLNKIEIDNEKEINEFIKLLEERFDLYEGKRK